MRLWMALMMTFIFKCETIKNLQCRFDSSPQHIELCPEGQLTTLTIVFQCLLNTPLDEKTKSLQFHIKMKDDTDFVLAKHIYISSECAVNNSKICLRQDSNLVKIILEKNATIDLSEASIKAVLLHRKLKDVNYSDVFVFPKISDSCNVNEVNGFPNTNTSDKDYPTKLYLLLLLIIPFLILIACCWKKKHWVKKRYQAIISFNSIKANKTSDTEEVERCALQSKEARTYNMAEAESGNNDGEVMQKPQTNGMAEKDKITGAEGGNDDVMQKSHTNGMIENILEKFEVRFEKEGKNGKPDEVINIEETDLVKRHLKKGYKLVARTRT